MTPRAWWGPWSCPVQIKWCLPRSVSHVSIQGPDIEELFQ